MSNEPNTYQNPACYARTIGGCCPKISGEHYVSQGVLKLIEKGYGEEHPEVRVEGLPFLPEGETRILPVKTLTGKVLCVNHNTLLSNLGYDQAGISLFRAMSDLNESVAQRRMLPNGWEVDGDALERWMLKTLCSGLASGNLIVDGLPSMKGNVPPDEWLRILYHGAKFPSRHGLYLFNAPKDEIITLDHNVMRMSVLSPPAEPAVYGLDMILFGFRFVLMMAPIGPGAVAQFAKGNFRPAGFKEQNTQNRIRFAWKVGPMSRDVVARSVVN